MTTSAGTNPYAPPKSRVADSEPNVHGLKKRSVLAMILFVCLSLGIYWLSGVMTFFFSIFYPQWAINRYAIAARS